MAERSWGRAVRDTLAPLFSGDLEVWGAGFILIDWDI
jgi:hypothetical protein